MQVAIHAKQKKGTEDIGQSDTLMRQRYMRASFASASTLSACLVSRSLSACLVSRSDFKRSISRNACLCRRLESSSSSWIPDFSAKSPSLSRDHAFFSTWSSNRINYIRPETSDNQQHNCFYLEVSQVFPCCWSGYAFTCWWRSRSRTWRIAFHNSRSRTRSIVRQVTFRPTRHVPL